MSEPLLHWIDGESVASVDGSVRAYATNAGQVCSSGTRLLVQRQVQDRFVEAVVTALRR